MDTAKRVTEEESWKSPPSLDKWWVEVSSLGRVRTLDHEEVFERQGETVKRRCMGKMLKPVKDTRGRFQIYVGKPQRLYLVHRLVAECFVANPNPQDFDMVFFKNKDVGDCRASNLEWGNKGWKGYLSRGNNSLYKIRVLHDGVEMGVYSGCGEAGRAIGASKQAVFAAIMDGRGCLGYELQAVKNG